MSATGTHHSLETAKRGAVFAMSSNALRTIWSSLGVLTFGFALTSALRTSGAAIETNLLPLGTNDPFSAALIAWPVLILLVAALLYVTTLYVTHPDIRGREPWESRIPIFYFDPPDIDPSGGQGQRYQRAIVFAFLVVPLLAQAVLLIKCFNGSAYLQKGTFASEWRHFWPETSVSWSQVRAGAYTFGHSEHGVTYFPWIQPYLYAFVECTILAFTWRVWRTVRASRLIRLFPRRSV